MLNWDDLEDRLSGDVDRQFAEPFLFCPRRAVPNKRPAADPDRDPQPFEMVFDERHQSVKAGRAQQKVSTTEPWADIQLDLLDCKIKKPDIIIRVKTGKAYEIIDVQPDGQGRAKLWTIYIGEHTECP
jgi:hypothetical protein